METRNDREAPAYVRPAFVLGRLNSDCVSDCDEISLICEAVLLRCATDDPKNVLVVSESVNDVSTKDFVFRIESSFLDGESSIEPSVRDRPSIFLAFPGVDGEPMLDLEGLREFELGVMASKIDDRSLGLFGVAGRPS